MQLVTPRGFRDILPQEALVRESISESVKNCFSKKGYLPIETPLLEDSDSLEAGAELKASPFRLFDTNQNLLTLRSDLTLPVARLIASRIKPCDFPVRVRYSAPVVREESSLKGYPRQFTQLGVELVGEDSLQSEYEILGLLAEMLCLLGVPGYHIVLASVAPYQALLKRFAPDKQFAIRSRQLLRDGDFVSFDELVQSAYTNGDLDKGARNAFRGLWRLSGDADILEKAKDLLLSAGIDSDEAGILPLETLCGHIKDLFASGHLSLDFSLVGSFDYYTGLIFKAYAAGISASVASGGRWDSLLQNFGIPEVPACGFAASLERLQEALGEQGDSGVVRDLTDRHTRPLRVAISKGSLYKETCTCLEAAGLDITPLEKPDRKLVIRAGDVEYIIVRAMDAPAFVARGGADCGICGFDALEEAGLDLLQLCDLKFGNCRFVVAEPKLAAGKAEETYAWRGTLRIASKYPRVAKAYYDRIGQQVDIVRLHGNIELGCIVGMADRIVDITATGATLAQNNLVAVDTFMECTARFFASPSAYRQDPRIKTLSECLQAVTN